MYFGETAWRKVGFVGWRGMVSLMDQMKKYNDFEGLEAVFFLTLARSGTNYSRNKESYKMPT